MYQDFCIYFTKILNPKARSRFNGDPLIEPKPLHQRKNYISKAVFKKDVNRFGCSECDRYFINRVGLATHIDSSAHHPLAYQCAGCQSQHTDLSSLLAHVEGSGCTKGITYGTTSIGKLLRHSRIQAMITWKVSHIHAQLTNWNRMRCRTSKIVIELAATVIRCRRS